MIYTYPKGKIDSRYIAVKFFKIFTFCSNSSSLVYMKKKKNIYRIKFLNI